MADLSSLDCKTTYAEPVNLSSAGLLVEDKIRTDLLAPIQTKYSLSSLIDHPVMKKQKTSKQDCFIDDEVTTAYGSTVTGQSVNPKSSFKMAPSSTQPTGSVCEKNKLKNKISEAQQSVKSAPTKNIKVLDSATATKDNCPEEEGATSSRLEKSLGENCKKFLQLFGA